MLLVKNAAELGCRASAIPAFLDLAPAVRPETIRKQFRAREELAQNGRKAMAKYEVQVRAVREKTARLKRSD
jgi:hypothetical protein